MLGFLVTMVTMVPFGYHGGLETGARINKLQKRNASGPEGTVCSTRWLSRTELFWRKGE